jgi:predicted RNase H-like nuclease (RuvC/YqgF family)
VAEFDDLQQQLAAARQAETGLATDLLSANESLKRLRRALDEARRRGSEAAIEELDAQIDQRNATVETLRADLGRSRAGIDDLRARFEDFTDPREHIGRLDDRVPICLMPLRLEVRFKHAAELPEAGDDVAGEMSIPTTSRSTVSRRR